MIGALIAKIPQEGICKEFRIMPIYEYQCEQCAQRMEALQKISDDPLRECPQCNQPALRKLVSAASFRLKGGGWYETDFKTGDKKQLAESGSDKEAKKETEAKPKAKEESSSSKSENTEKKSDSKKTKSEASNSSQKKAS